MSEEPCNGQERKTPEDLMNELLTVIHNHGATHGLTSIEALGTLDAVRSELTNSFTVHRPAAN